MFSYAKIKISKICFNADFFNVWMSLAHTLKAEMAQRFVVIFLRCSKISVMEIVYCCVGAAAVFVIIDATMSGRFSADNKWWTDSFNVLACFLYAVNIEHWNYTCIGFMAILNMFNYAFDWMSMCFLWFCYLAFVMVGGNWDDFAVCLYKLFIYMTELIIHFCSNKLFLSLNYICSFNWESQK